MEIERINDDTVKFYISYLDIEERGFDREEIWYSREKSEELFWEMMDEIHQEEEFIIEGPLWIQVQALEKGLEILVTKAQFTKDGQKFDFALSDDKLKSLQVDGKIESLLGQNFEDKEEDNEMLFEDGLIEFITEFDDFEDVIALSKRCGSVDWTTKLFAYQNKYYLYMEFAEEDVDEEEIDNILSLILEYSNESSITVHMLEEYGKVVIEEDVFVTVSNYFA